MNPSIDERALDEDAVATDEAYERRSLASLRAVHAVEHTSLDALAARTAGAFPQTPSELLAKTGG